MLSKEWFEEWFDSPYYHLLYQERDEKEAQQFIDLLSEFLQFRPTDYLLDLACGKGRYAIYLNTKGLNVCGIDLSEPNITAAQAYRREGLAFFRHDMRQIYRAETFDYVLNMFTSFGYFAQDHENKEVIKASAANLKKGGKLLIDFLNPEVAIRKLVPSEEKHLNGIRFLIEKKIDRGFIFKKITFEADGQPYTFEERVRLLSYDDFRLYFDEFGLQPIGTDFVFGDYQLNPFDVRQSERMIFIVKK
jgi:SAM-dependent methyltransferase